jgi:hypothetical protein
LSNDLEEVREEEGEKNGGNEWKGRRRMKWRWDSEKKEKKGERKEGEERKRRKEEEGEEGGEEEEGRTSLDFINLSQDSIASSLLLSKICCSPMCAKNKA